MTPQLLAFALLAIPLLSATLIAFFMRRNGSLAAGVSVGAAALMLAVAGHLIFRMEMSEPFNLHWITLGNMSLDFGFLIDELAKIMLFVVTFVGFLIHVFSLGYMKGDSAKARFFGGLSIFMFSMIGLVMASSLITLFIFWELVGFSSYMLIGFYLDKPSAAAASKKAFIVNRIGDFGFLIGIILAFWAFGTLDLAQMRQVFAVGDYSLAMPGLTAIGLLLFCGAVGKSGQIPLHVWLPDAMEGPTPVSALIHAATMVAAGVFLLCRIGFLMTADALQVVLWIGVATALFAGFPAIGQRDIKRILAYSTVAQLGYMVAAFALGTLAGLAGNPDDPQTAVITGGVAAAMFHLTTHAFFKALLFLGSGSIIHACHHEQDIFKMGGLLSRMKITALTFTIGVLALIGMPLLAGFYSKDAILALALEVSPLAFYLLVFGAFLTAFYMTRLWLIVFLGEAKSDHADHAKENGWVMTAPLIILAILSIFGGYTGLYPQVFSPITELVAEINHGEGHTTVMIASSIAMLIAVVVGFFLYGPGAKEDRFARKAGPAYTLFERRFYIDHAYDFYVAKIQQRVANFLGLFDLIAIGGLAVRGLAGVAAVIGLGLKALHVGNLHHYVYWFIGGVAIFWALAVGF